MDTMAFYGTLHKYFDGHHTKYIYGHHTIFLWSSHNILWIFNKYIWCNFENRITIIIINLYIYKICPFGGIYIVILFFMIYSNGLFMLHRYFMDYCTDILWIIAQRYFMDYCTNIFYAIFRTEYQKIIINLYIYKKCPFESYI